MSLVDRTRTTGTPPSIRLHGLQCGGECVLFRGPDRSFAIAGTSKSHPRAAEPFSSSDSRCPTSSGAEGGIEDVGISVEPFGGEAGEDDTGATMPCNVATAPKPHRSGPSQSPPVHPWERDAGGSARKLLQRVRKRRRRPNTRIVFVTGPCAQGPRSARRAKTETTWSSERPRNRRCSRRRRVDRRASSRPTSFESNRRRCSSRKTSRRRRHCIAQSARGGRHPQTANAPQN